MNAFLSAVALLNASQRHDGPAVRAIVEAVDTQELAAILAQMLATAIRSDRMTIEGFCEMQIDKTIGCLGESA